MGLIRTLANVALAVVSVVASSCSQEEAKQTDQHRICISRLYAKYNPKDPDQCLNVCKSCLGGNTVTCSTSCKLRGGLN